MQPLEMAGEEEGWSRTTEGHDVVHNNNKSHNSTNSNIVGCSSSSSSKEQGAQEEERGYTDAYRRSESVRHYNNYSNTDSCSSRDTGTAGGSKEQEPEERGDTGVSRRRLTYEDLKRKQTQVTVQSSGEHSSSASTTY